MTENIVMGVAAILLSLAFGYAPGLKDWYEKQDNTRKVQVMGLFLILAAAVIFGAACYTPFQSTTCDEAGFWGLVELLGVALIANQTTYTFAVRPFKQVKTAKTAS